MIQTQCPDCKKDISVNALNCIHCGRSIYSSEDLRMRFETLIEDIKYTKDRQWTITYYLLLLYSGLIALGRIDNICYGIEIFLGLLGLSILVFGIRYLNDLIVSIQRYRKYLWEDILPKLTIKDTEVKPLIKKFEYELENERKKNKQNKESFDDEDEKKFIIKLHIEGKDSKKWYFRAFLLFAFMLQLIFMKDFIPFLQKIFSWSFNC